MLDQFLVQVDRAYGQSSVRNIRKFVPRYDSWAKERGLNASDQATMQTHLVELAAAGLSPSTIATAKNWIKRYVEFLGGKMPGGNGNGNAYETNADAAGASETAPESSDAASVEEIASRAAERVAQTFLDRMPRGQVRKQTRLQATPQGPSLARMFPRASEHVKVYKRLGDEPGAKTTYVGLFSTQDLKGCINIEQFLQKYVIPSFGYGDFVVTLVNGQGAEVQTDTFSLLDPRSVAQTMQQGPMNMLRDLYQQQVQAPLPPVPVDPYQQSTNRLEGMFDKLSQQMRGPDPKDLLIQKLLEKVDEKPTPVPTPQGPSLSEIAQLLSTTVAQAVASAVPRTPPTNALQDALALIQVLKPQQTERAPDMFESFQKFATLRKEFIGPIEEQNKELRQKIDRVLDQPPADVLDDVQKVVQMHEMLKRMVSAGGDESWAGTVQTVFKGLPQVGQLIDKAKGLAEAQAKLKAAPGGQAQELAASQSVSPKPAPGAAPYPAGFGDYLAQIQGSKSPREEIETTLRGFEFLGKHPHWDKYYRTMYQAGEKGDIGAIKYIEALLKYIEHHGHINEAKRQSVVRNVTENWGLIRTVAFGYAENEAA